MGDGFEDGGFGDFVKHDAACRGGVELEHFGQVPRDGFSLAVFIGGEPDGVGLLGLGAEFAHHACLVGRNFIFGLERLEVDSKVFLLQVADVPETGHHLEIVAQKALDGLGLGRALHDD